MSQKNDQVFNLSITEIWMVIAFLLLLLTGYQVYKLNSEKIALEQKVVSFDNIDEREKALQNTTAELKARLAGMSIKNPDEVISKLVDASKARDEASQLKVLLTQKEQEVTALAAIDKALQESSSNDKSEQAKRLVLETLMSYDQLKKLVTKPNQEVQPTDVVKRVEALNATEQFLKTAMATEGDLTDTQIQELVTNAQAFAQAEKDGLNPATLQKTNTDLRGQVQFLQNRLNKGKGGDFPPCWADSAGKPEMFLTVFLKENDLTFEPAWPPSRLADAQALPGFNDLMANSNRSYDGFLRATQAIKALGEKNECRYFVRLASQIQDAPTSDKRRIQVENNFYKIEVRRW
ncbi:hypothetical protein J2X84_001988 [Pseudomonas corrugata]|uniref:hypothetical protein n=1 Tax=Pseudomonas corrugata TaxID=47879 RepID=UPI00285A6751|nr:hypothetical protein [Pseudomonas corrugata]MDR7283164.1 hypothetical protein [Pseudomonas corrugata]